MLHTERQNANFFFGTKESSIMRSFDLGMSTSNEQIYVGKPQDRDGHILATGKSRKWQKLLHCNANP